MIYAVLLFEKYAPFYGCYAVKAVNTEKHYEITLPLNDIKNYMKLHKEAIQMVK